MQAKVQSDDFEVDAPFGLLQKTALEALGNPRGFYYCRALLLERGGDDGLWMRALGRADLEWRRMGVLVLAPAGLAYSELARLEVTRRFRGPKTGIGGATLQIPRSDVLGVEINICTPSPYGVYTCASIQTRGGRLTIGLELAHPGIMSVTPALRDLGSSHLQLDAPAESPLRYDGVYLGARQGVHGRSCAVFTQNAVTWTRTQDPLATYSLLKSGGSDGETEPFTDAAGAVTTASGRTARTTVSGLVYQEPGWRQQRQRVFSCLPYEELCFVDEQQLASESVDPNLVLQDPGLVAHGDQDGAVALLPVELQDDTAG